MKAKRYLQTVDSAILMHIIKYILIGGWPSVCNMSLEQGMLVAKEYLKSVLSEDIFKIIIFSRIF